MKAILLIDMPDSCSQCEYLGEAINDDIKACTLSQLFFHKDFDIESGREVICPLKPMPKKKSHEKFSWGAERIETTNDFEDGWNACLEELEK